MSSSTISTRDLVRKVTAEMIGTFALVFAGCGAIMVSQSAPEVVGHGAVCAVFGLVIMSMIFATGHVSGAHFNPAVTVAFAIIGRFPWPQVPYYILGQCVAAVSAAALLSVNLGDDGVLGSTALAPDLNVASGFLLEVVFTFFLMFVITSVATDSRAVGQSAGIAIGGTVALVALFGGPLTGGSMNPARTLGPGLISNNLEHLWLYIAAPILGAGLGALCYDWVRCDTSEGPEDADGCC
jgi:MIP family channel proteins